jgi:hypothetical protein
VWQQEYPGLARPDFEFVSIAVDPGGPEDPRPYVEAAGATFPALVDARGASSVALGFTVVPNGVLVDETGVVRFRKDGGFSNAKPRDLEAVRRFARGEDPGPSPEAAAAPYELDALSRELVATKMELGRALFALGRRDEALARWREAVHLDPENKTIRKAIWGIEHPERFHPVIDDAWQREQFEHERAEEIAAGICGPDGCPLPAPAR